MKVKMNDTVATPVFTYLRGETYDVEDDYGQTLITGGLAANTKSGDDPTSADARNLRHAQEADAVAGKPARQTMDRPTGTPVEDAQIATPNHPAHIRNDDPNGTLRAPQNVPAVTGRRSNVITTDSLTGNVHPATAPHTAEPVPGSVIAPGAPSPTVIENAARRGATETARDARTGRNEK